MMIKELTVNFCLFQTTENKLLYLSTRKLLNANALQISIVLFLIWMRSCLIPRNKMPRTCCFLNQEEKEKYTVCLIYRVSIRLVNGLAQQSVSKSHILVMLPGPLFTVVPMMGVIWKLYHEIY
ncbi:hypothetical protein BDF21DRAFT_409870 [Thamnidium elegans]|nr:hypothetical protein BDF21DRAFT_409870 [Thamnidium elegans]